ncbi:hypothetical protein PpBr36_05421 [Pyricularia pennisetigena]|uniref:hypothetical protein n=1 Tax=Pyricularia pennisetigena TaxID=1578925 RepID=UPI001153A059|nr:hypothetical protein PpBr36_05421 [Pyricularia pennisetigena]TLS27543.1 hypothetical protein PpBr36_05421 [Pyricularia pennisetigena]
MLHTQKAAENKSNNSSGLFSHILVSSKAGPTKMVHNHSLTELITGPIRKATSRTSTPVQSPVAGHSTTSSQTSPRRKSQGHRSSDDDSHRSDSLERKARKEADKLERRLQEQELIDARRRSEDMKAREHLDEATRARFGEDVVFRELTPIAQLVTLPVGSEVTFRARIHHQRDISKALDFLLLRDQTHSIQGVLQGPPEMVKWVQRLHPESIVQITGHLQCPKEPVRSATHPDLEVLIDTIHLVAPAKNLPFSNYQPPESLHPRLTNRVLDLRHPANQALFRVRAAVTRTFRWTLDQQGFVEIQTPKIMAGATESGAEVFKVNYFGRSAYLAQSPQLSKQMAISADFKRVYEVGPVFRAENSNTHRHLTEYTGLDIEICIDKSHHEIIRVVDRVLKNIFAAVHRMEELKAIRERWPSEDLVWLEETPILTFPEALQMLREDGNQDIEENDLSTRDESRLGELVKEKYKTDYFILDKFPAVARPFYTHKDDHDPKWTNSFDIFVRGQEICTGGQRIHKYEELRQSMTDSGITGDGMEEYLAAFESGAPPHGGAGLGLERIITFMLKLGDVRNAAPFHRDPKSLPYRPPGLPHPEASTRRRKSAQVFSQPDTKEGLHGTATTNETNPGTECSETSPKASAETEYPPLEKLIANYGDATNTSWLDDRFQIWRHSLTGAAVGYVRQSKDLVIMTGNPLCDPSQYAEIIGAYLDFVKNTLKCKPIWLLVSEEVQRILANEPHNWRTMTCSEEQRIPADDQARRGLSRPGAQRSARRVQREGIRLHEVRPEKDENFKQRANKAIEEWHRAREGKKQVHLTEIRPWVDADHRRYFAAERDGRVLGLVVLHRLAPRYGWQVKWALDMPSAPNGTIEALVDLALMSISGSPATFGVDASEKLVPVAHIGGAKTKILTRAYDAFVKGAGLARKKEFREKFGVVGEAVFICYPKGAMGMGEIREVLRVNLTTQKRLAASVLDCGKNKIWLDPNEVSEISNANSRQTIRKLVQDGLIIKKPVTMHSRARARELNLARRIGRHRGFGKRKGTADARMPTQVVWMRRQRVLRRLLVKYRASGKIDKHLYHELYHSAKGNTFKHKRALVEHIHRAKAEKQRERLLKDEMDAKRAKTKAARERKLERQAAKRNALAGEAEE